MTEQYYIAVKGSLHASDSSVFGLTPEEVNALSKRYPDSNKEVINGVLIKASPLKTINSLGELGYRVICSSGEAEIVWTLRREVLATKPMYIEQKLPRGTLANSKLDEEFRKNKLEEVDDHNPDNKKDLQRRDNEIHERITLVLEGGKFTLTNNERLNAVLQEANLLPEDSSSGPSKVNDEDTNKDGEKPSTIEKLPYVERKEETLEKNDENAKANEDRTKKKEIPKKKVEKIGSKPEDFAEYSTYKGPKIVIKNPEPEECKEEEGGIILNTNVESPENPFASGYYPSRIQHSTVTAMSSPHQHTSHALANPSLHQTLDEMDFERGIWMPAISGDIQQVCSHLNKGVHPDIEDACGYTALHYAARCGHPQIVIQLIKAGATVDKPTRAGGATALHRAALAGHHEVCCILLRYGANMRARDIDGRTPLHRAVEGGHTDIIEEFLKISPSVAFEKDNKGKSPLSYAEEKGAVSQLFMDIVNKNPS